jgi:hypothetical protein
VACCGTTVYVVSGWQPSATAASVSPVPLPCPVEHWATHQPPGGLLVLHRVAES